MDAQQLRELVMGFQPSRVVLTAFELGVFTALADGHRTADAVARAVGAEARAVDRLMNALVALGLLHKHDGRFDNAPLADRVLVRGRPEDMAGLHHTVHLWDTWSGLTTAVRTGSPVHEAAVNDRGDEWLDAFIAAMHWRARPQADAMAGLLGLGKTRRMLDVGGGSGAFAIACANAQPALTAVVFDLPNVLPLTRKYVEEARLAGRITTAVGDYTRDPLPQGFDLVLLSAIVHSNPPAVNEALVRAAAGATTAGGRVAIVDWVMSPDRTEPLTGALFALNMLVGTDGGDTYTEAEIRGWLDAAGLIGVERLDTRFGTSIMTGTR